MENGHSKFIFTVSERNDKQFWSQRPKTVPNSSARTRTQRMRSCWAASLPILDIGDCRSGAYIELDQLS